MKPRLLLVARTRYRLPLSPSLERKFDALGRRFDLTVLATSADGPAVERPPFRLVPRAPVLDGPLFWLRLPQRVRRLVRRARPDAILVQGPYEAAFVRLARPRVPVIVELHGDWRTATRLYGSRARGLLAPVADAVGAWGIRHADAIRTLSPWTTQLVRELGCEPTEEFVAYTDLELFLDRPREPLPAAPRVLFVGVLERYKNVDGLARAWSATAARVPDAQLHVVGDGSMRDTVEALVASAPGRVTWSPRLEQRDVARALDESTVLVLPSRSEGLPRIVIEALTRGRGVVAARAGGIPDIVEDGVNGRLVSDDDALASALAEVLEDRALAERLAAGAAATAARWQATPDEYAARVEALVRPYTVTP